LGKTQEWERKGPREKSKTYKPLKKRGKVSEQKREKGFQRKRDPKGASPSWEGTGKIKKEKHRNGKRGGQKGRPKEGEKEVIAGRYFQA